MRTPQRKTTTEERFWRRVKVVEGDGCWEWLGSKTEAGYGIFHDAAGKLVYAHRYAYEREHGPLPKGYQACHHCDNRGCARGSHLFKGTQSDNSRDMVSKGRDRNQNKGKTHCIRGHEFTGNNLAIGRDGSRVCRACSRETQRTIRANRGLKGRRRSRCKRGHLLEGSNLILRQRVQHGKLIEVRECRACHNERTKLSKQRVRRGKRNGS